MQRRQIHLGARLQARAWLSRGLAVGVIAIVFQQRLAVLVTIVDTLTDRREIDIGGLANVSVFQKRLHLRLRRSDRCGSRAGRRRIRWIGKVDWRDLLG